MEITDLYHDSGLMTLEIKVNGKNIPEEFHMQKWFVEQSVNHVGLARITFLQEVTTDKSAVLNSDSVFKLGSEIQITAGYDKNNQSIFTGIISGQRVKADGVSGASLIVECRDTAAKMTVNCKSNVFVDMSDSELMSKIISQHTGLISDISKTDVRHSEMVQYECSDWEFILSRAQSNGMVISTSENQVRIFDPLLTPRAVWNIKYGDSLLSLDVLTDAMPQCELAKIVGKVKVLGVSCIKPGDNISLSDVGQGFDGNHFVSKVVHEFVDGNWTTALGLGLATELASKPTPKTSALLTYVSGLYNAKVINVLDDPESQFRIQIAIEQFGDGGEPIWARLIQFYAGKGRGAYFPPEVGDEVIVGFLNGDPRFPVVLGSLYSQTVSPASELLDDNNSSQKGIVTRAGLKMVFDDESKVTSILTPGGNQFVLDDKKQQIAISDKCDNKILLSEQGIDIVSVKDINIQSAQTINIQGTDGVNILSDSADISVKGLNVVAQADMDYSASGNTSASVQTSGTLSLNGAMVLIN